MSVVNGKTESSWISGEPKSDYAIEQYTVTLLRKVILYIFLRKVIGNFMNSTLNLSSFPTSAGFE